MITYTGIEWDSPTINIINLLKSSGSQGLTENAIMKKLGHQTFVNNRLEQLISDGIVRECNDVLYCDNRIGLSVRISDFLCRMIGVNKG